MIKITPKYYRVEDYLIALPLSQKMAIRSPVTRFFGSLLKLKPNGVIFGALSTNSSARRRSITQFIRDLRYDFAMKYWNVLTFYHFMNVYLVLLILLEDCISQITQAQLQWHFDLHSIQFFSFITL